MNKRPRAGRRNTFEIRGSLLESAGNHGTRTTSDNARRTREEKLAITINLATPRAGSRKSAGRTAKEMKIIVRYFLLAGIPPRLDLTSVLCSRSAAQA